MKRYLHIKKLATTDTTTSNETTDPTELTDSFTDDTTTTVGKRNSNFLKITDSDYKRPKAGTKQDNFTKEDILKKLEGYTPLRTMEEKKILSQLPTFKTWIRYINVHTKQFRTGGLLMKVSYPDYITLLNPGKQLTWSVQIRDNLIYVKDPKETIAKNEESELKERLFSMYAKGQLTFKRN